MSGQSSFEFAASWTAASIRYQYKWVPGGWVDSDFRNRLSDLYSKHYGVWGKGAAHPIGDPVRLSSARLMRWLNHPDARLAWAETDTGELIGYAVVVQTTFRGRMVSWVTQLVVHEKHRNNDVGKTLLFSAWGFSDHYAWGIITANPYAVRALEKATRRRCAPDRILRDAKALERLGAGFVPYMSEDTELAVNVGHARINTRFFLDHTNLPEMLSSVTSQTRPWKLGPLEPGWEWFAFTFLDQAQIQLTQEELREMLLASDEITRRAYSRMSLGRAHRWAQNTNYEIDFVIANCKLSPGQSVVDFGCGKGRHVLELARRGYNAVGVDYAELFIKDAQTEAKEPLQQAEFVIGDCRTVSLEGQFDAGICLYDVVGSYADTRDNSQVLLNLARHVTPGGFILLSVMNVELTRQQAEFFSISAEPDKLLKLKASNLMEQSGEIFDPNYYLIDIDAGVVYRKEQFSLGVGLPEELLVRDKRFTLPEITDLCNHAGLEVLWSRFVRSGKWEQSLPPTDSHAKEILLLCRKAILPGLTMH